uniref:Uncharacterized protein n=1 Tax=Prolemur simus TaxID=1328070 RepID=A0A8C8YR38_PROSS
MSHAALDPSSEIISKDLKEKKEVMERAAEGRHALANGDRGSLKLMPPHSSPGNRVRLCLKKKKK